MICLQAGLPHQTEIYLITNWSALRCAATVPLFLASDFQHENKHIELN